MAFRIYNTEYAVFSDILRGLAVGFRGLASGEKPLLQGAQVLPQGRVQSRVHEGLERFQIVADGGVLKRVEIGFSILGAHGNGRVSTTKQEQVHDQPCGASVAVSERMNGD